VRVYEDTAALPRAFVVPEARPAPSLGAALTEMVHRPFQPTQEVILAHDSPADATPPPGAGQGGQGSAQITAYDANAVSVHTSTSGPAWLVLSDTFYPGWIATVDGQPTPVLRGDVLFRVVSVPGGEHDVQLRFEPGSIKLGLAISLVFAAIVIATLVGVGIVQRRSRTTGR
jgi:hypothetical protein